MTDALDVHVKAAEREFDEAADLHHVPPEVERRPCPFCGKDKTILNTPHEREQFAVICLPCQARGPSSFRRREAANMWNKRRPVRTVYVGCMPSQT